MAICVQISPNGIEHESRIIRTCKTLIESGVFEEVYYLGAADQPTPDDEWLQHPAGFKYRLLRRDKSTAKGPLQKLLYTFQFRKLVVDIVSQMKPSVVAVRTLPTAPAGLKIKAKTKAKLVYDVHELETETIAQTPLRQWFSRKLESRVVQAVDGIVVVNNRIADWYQAQYSIVRPAVVRAIPDSKSFPDPNQSNILRDTFGIPEEHFLFVIQGLFVRGRAVEFFLEVFKQANQDRHIVFMGYGPLQDKIIEAAKTHPNIHFQTAVPSDEVLRYTSSADIGIAGVENLCLSYYLSLPNKFMEYAFSGIPILAPDFPEMGDLVKQFQCGTTFSHSVEETVKQINQIDRVQLEKWKQGSLKLRSSLSWSEESKVLVSAYSNALKN